MCYQLSPDSYHIHTTSLVFFRRVNEVVSQGHQHVGSHNWVFLHQKNLLIVPYLQRQRIQLEYRVLRILKPSLLELYRMSQGLFIVFSDFQGFNIDDFDIRE
jgi:hypothetical protein